MTRFGWIGRVANLHPNHPCTKSLIVFEQDPGNDSSTHAGRPQGQPTTTCSRETCINLTPINYPFSGCDWNILSLEISLIFENRTHCYTFTPHYWPGGFKFGVWGACSTCKGTEPNVLQHASSMEDIDVNFSRHLRSEIQTSKSNLGWNTAWQSMTTPMRLRSLTVVSRMQKKRMRWCTLPARNDEKCQKSNLQVMGDVPLASRHTSWCIACPVLVH